MPQVPDHEHAPGIAASAHLQGSSEKCQIGLLLPNRLRCGNVWEKPAQAGRVEFRQGREIYPVGGDEQGQAPVQVANKFQRPVCQYRMLCQKLLVLRIDPGSFGRAPSQGFFHFKKEMLKPAGKQHIFRDLPASISVPVLFVDFAVADGMGLGRFDPVTRHDLQDAARLGDMEIDQGPVQIEKYRVKFVQTA